LATGTATEGDVEQQQFLSVSDYRPQNNTNTINNNKINSNQIQSNNNINGTTDNNNDVHAHPQAAFFTIIFKAISIILYLFGSWTVDNFVLIFIFVILSLAADFWTVKNVTGRLLVGLRWWNDVKEDGTSEWKFQARDDATAVNNKDSRLFWFSLYITPAVWILLFIAAIVKFNLKWIPLTMVGIVLNGAQLYGYYKCQKDAKQKIQKLLQRGFSTIGVGLLNAQIKSMQNSSSTV